MNAITSVVTVQEEYEKNTNIKPEDIKLLLGWVEEQNHLPKITELEALIFLSGQHGDQKLTKIKIEMYYTSRTKIPEFFQDRNPKNLSRLDVVSFTPLDIPRQYDRTIYCRMADTDPAKIDLAEQVKIIGMVCDLWILKEGSAPGYQFIVDAAGTKFGHVLRLRIGTLKKAIYVLQETLPINVTYIHIINAVPAVEKIFNMGKPFIKSYLLHKIMFHTHGIESLDKYVPNDYIPKELGGNGPTFDELHNKMKQTLFQNIDYFKEEELTKRTDESRRKKIEPSSFWMDMFGSRNTT